MTTLSPKKCEVIKDNLVRISVLAKDDQSGVQYVDFLTTFWDLKGEQTTDTLIYRDSVEPYEYVWDVS